MRCSKPNARSDLMGLDPRRFPAMPSQSAREGAAPGKKNGIVVQNRDVISVNARCIEHVDSYALVIERGDCRHSMPPGPDVP